VSAATGARVALRTRSGLEAIDLGVAMARTWWRPLASTWLVFVLPMGCAVVWLLGETPGWAIVALWLLRPAFARIPLDVFSRELFGERASVAATARALPRLLLATGLPHSLTLGRFATARTFLQPVQQLEGLRGAARRERERVLARSESGGALALTTVIAHLNGMIGLGLIALAWLFAPPEIGWGPTEMVFGDEAIPGVVPALYLVGISVSEPLLVAGGFALYVNRRIFLEGWEIELAFRRLAARAAGPRANAGLAAALLLALFVAAAPPARASDCVPDDAASAGDCIADVLRDPDFGAERTEVRWMPKEFDPEAPDADLSWLENLVRFIVQFARVLLYGGLAIAVLAILFALRGRRFDLSRAPRPGPQPVSRMGLDLRPESLPEDVVAAARAAWASGDAVLALSLLYRGALVRLAQRGALEIPESATENECLRAIQRTQPDRIAGAFGALTRAWVRARYGHTPPLPLEFGALCDGFRAFEVSA
jgi:hypothetical protein